MELSFLDTESLDSFGLPPNTLSDLPGGDTSGLPTIRPPTVQNRLGLRRHRGAANPSTSCHVIKTKGMVFRYTWVYSKEDTMAHTYRAVVTS